MHLSVRTPSRGSRHGIRWGGRLVALGAAFACLAFPAHAGAEAGRAVVVTAHPGAAAAAEHAVERAGGRITAAIPLVDGLAATIPPGAAAELRRDPAIRSLVPDVRFAPADADSAAAATQTTVDIVARTLGADRVPSAGDGVDVALVDTGVAAAPALDEVVVDGLDLSSTGDDEDLRGLDAFGHGTHLAGIIHGVAPRARILNVKVAEPDGATTLRRLLMAIDWVVHHRRRDGLSVGVLNLAYGAPPEGSYRSDPLAYALERAQRAGITVVTSAGNGGEESDGLDSPAYDPNLLAVGASDAAGTPELADDAIPVWSSHGDGERDPDIVAPGTGIVSLAAPDSYLHANFPGARVGEDGFRGSGTSQAAAAVSGLAAAILSARPGLAPGQVKALLVATARPLPGVGRLHQGAGVPDAGAAVATVAPQRTAGAPPATPGGAWRGGGGPMVQLAVDPDASRWSASRWSASRWSASRWSASRWSASRWSASRWSASRWSASRWSASRWSASRWSASRWSASRWSAGDWASAEGP